MVGGISHIGNTIGYAGYVWDPHTGGPNGTGSHPTSGGDAPGLWLSRHRYYSPHLARWTTRDPAGYVDGPNLYEYVGGYPLIAIDPYGLRREYDPVRDAFEGAGIKHIDDIARRGGTVRAGAIHAPAARELIDEVHGDIDYVVETVQDSATMALGAASGALAKAACMSACLGQQVGHGLVTGRIGSRSVDIAIDYAQRQSSRYSKPIRNFRGVLRFLGRISSRFVTPVMIATDTLVPDGYRDICEERCAHAGECGNDGIAKFGGTIGGFELDIPFLPLQDELGIPTAPYYVPERRFYFW